jgi:hypothetical protein
LGDNNWLPENYVLRLTALEAGALMACLELSKERFPALTHFKVNVKGRNKPVSMMDRLIEKLEEERARHD